MIRVFRVAMPVLVVALAGCPKDPNDLPKGCINIDGEGDYDTIAEAVAAASAGQTIHLCEAHFDESVTVDKDLVFDGESASDTYWMGLTNQEALHVEGANVTVRRIGIESSRSGITVTDGALTVDRVSFWGVANYGVDAANSDVIATEVDVSDAGWGGFNIDGGSLDLSDSTITARGNGVKVADGTANLTGNEISEVFPLADSDLSEGGWGLWLDSSVGTLEGNSFHDNAADVYVEGAGGDVTMTGDSMTGSYYGAWFESTSGTLTDVTIDQYLQYGIVQNGGQSLTLTNVAITTDPEISAPQEEADYTGFSGSVGIIAFGADLTITGGVISGNNGGGLYQADDVGPAKFDVTGLVIDGNARYGIVTSQAEAKFTDVTISNTLDNDASCVQDYGYYQSFNCNAGLWSSYSQVTWEGGSLTNGGAIGATVLGDSLSLVGVTLDHAGNYGVWGVGAAVTTDGSTFEGSAEKGLFLMNDAVGVIQNSTFKDTSYAVDYPLDDVTTYRYYYYGQDIDVYQSTVIIDGSTFQDGDNGVSVYDGTVEVTNSTWDGYNSDALYASFDATLVITGSKFTNIGNDAIGCYSGAVQIDGVTIEGVTQEQSKSERYDNGELQEEMSYEFAFVGEAMYMSDCDLVADDLVVKNSTGTAVYARDSAIELDTPVFVDVSKSDSSYDAGLYFTWLSDAPNVSITDLTLSGVANGDGMRLSGAGGTNGSVSIDGASVGKDVNGVSGVQLNGLYLQNIGGSTSIANFDLGGVGRAGLVLDHTPALVESGTVRDAGTDGVYVIGSPVELADVTVVSATQAGVHFADSETHTVRDSTVTGTTYGLACDADPVATVLECDTNTLAGGTGDVLGCSGCVAAPPDTGTTP